MDALSSFNWMDNDGFHSSLSLSTLWPFHYEESLMAESFEQQGMCGNSTHTFCCFIDVRCYHIESFDIC